MQPMIKAYVPCERCSYEQVARYESYLITRNVFEADVCIDDPVIFLRKFRSIIDDIHCILWGDTVYNALYYAKEMVRYDNFIVASQWNYEMFKKVGITPKKVVKRHIKPVIVENQYEEDSGTYYFDLKNSVSIHVKKVFPDKSKDKLFITLGESRYFDRKNLTLIDELTRQMGLRKYTIIVGNMGNPDYQTFSLSEVDKYRLYARAKFFLALSKSEGFGLPPIEAMAIGVIPIYVNAHGYKENLVGLPIDPIDEYTYTPDGINYFKVWDFSLHELKYEIIHAINMGKDEYDDLVAKVKKQAEKYILRGEPKLPV